LEQSILQSQSLSKALDGVTVVIPVYKEDPSFLNKTYSELTSIGAEVIIVNDGDTVELDVPSLDYWPNMGYGYAIKQGIRASRNKVVLTMDGDGQHTVSDAIKLTTVFRMIPDCKMVVGCRWNLKERPIRWIFRKIINFIASCIASHYLVDLNSGMRIFDRDMAHSYSPILCDTFSFTTSLTMSVVTDGHKVAYFPIDVQPRNFGKSRVRLLRDGFVTMYYILWVGLALRTRRIRSFLRGR
jgi:glycosyltransferase involved in cell wall biosynthesis